MELCTDESERPSEWLRNLKESASGYAELLRDSGNAIVAAYRVAVARCRASARATHVPTLREVHAALYDVLVADGTVDFALPSLRSLVADCEDAGLLVTGGSQRVWMS